MAAVKKPYRTQMSFADLCADGESEARVVNDEKPNLLQGLAQDRRFYKLANCHAKSADCYVARVSIENTKGYTENGATDELQTLSQGSARAPLSRQFWSAGDYEAGQTSGTLNPNVQNRLCVHPKFLHSNATSHKWAFGAIAELLDNAVDEIQNGATFVIIDKITNPRNGSPALLIQDDGGGMDPESLRRCMSFGFSDKQSCSSIGQYGNGFKTSTMRLGADVIVFSSCINGRELTQSVGLLSYTFLRKTGHQDIVVPMVYYMYNPLTGVTERLIRHSQNQMSSNLSVLLNWSPFATEDELLQNFSDIGHHGTKIIIFNLWFNDEGVLELDFDADIEDIIITGVPRSVERNDKSKILTQKHIASRLRYSLRAYSSILYLHLPDYFRIILRGREVEHHHIINDLRYCECIKYNPKVCGKTEAEVITTIGFLDGSPYVNVHGFNIYHKNRLILPFHRIVNSSGSKGRGIAGVLEANFIKPTHDKQGFERSTIYQKLENRLREMTYEYWEYHCHLLGYTKDSLSVPTPHQLLPSICNGLPDMMNTRISEQPTGCSTQMSTGNKEISASCASSLSTSQELSSSYNAVSQLGVLGKRRREKHIIEMGSVERQEVDNESERSSKKQLCHGVDESPVKKNIRIMHENKKLHAECLEYEKTERELLLKEQQLRRELEHTRRLYKNLIVDLVSTRDVKSEKL
ncbi:protein MICRORCHIDIA 6-like isoform X1 [Typha angustifolia]|uniref:protein MICRORCHIDIA 6-like isoform X1 n=2 Tax=Typha angustifolia TaxID=59011 RepID=UPI003C2C3F2E